MALPINITELLHGDTVEWDRIEFKKGWNPEDVIHSICAFANDINNWGGGYIFIGIEEEQGLPVLPPKGVAKSKLDAIQKELLSLMHQLQPFYAPVSQPYLIDGKYILIIWIPGGDNRPYKAPISLGKKGEKVPKRYYVRRGSVTVLAKQNEEELLLQQAKKIPFDDRVNHHAQVADFSFGLIRDFLEKVGSDLRKDAAKMPLEELALQMRIASGPREALLPLNVGLLFFSEDPTRFFRGASTDLVIYKDNSARTFTERTYKGPIQHQMQQILDFFKGNIIEERVNKVSTKAESDRLFNYPYEAVEEVISNAFYHRSYDLENPIEINIWPDKIEVLSFAGPMPPVTQAMLKQRRIVTRNYRNRRIGDFLKELELTEGRATGFPTIYDSMKENGSPKPVFETDDDYNYFLAILPIHSDFKKVQKEVKLEKQVSLGERTSKILEFCLDPKSRKEILEHLGLFNNTLNYRKNIEPLVKSGWLNLTEPGAVRSPNQQYLTTEQGKNKLKPD